MSDLPLDTGDVEPRRGPPTETVIFAVMAVAFAVAGVVYGVFDTYGDVGGISGEVFFAAGAVFAGLAAWYFRSSLRRVQSDVEQGERERVHAPAEQAAAPDSGGLYLPETSVWPICIGVGTALTLVGIPLKWWFFLPGVALVTFGFIGFAHQSRTRT